MRAKPGRNDPCHCGSGKKYKRCCLEADAAATSAALAAERDRLNGDEDLWDDDDIDHDRVPGDADWDHASPFDPTDVLLVSYKRGLAHSRGQIPSGQGFETTEWIAPDIPAEILDVFEREAAWELDGWWGDQNVAHPVEFDLITIQSTQGEVVIEVQNRGVVLAMGREVEDLASITRICTILDRAAERGTGRSWISQADGDDDAFEDGNHYDPDAGPNATEWLALSDVERTARVRSWHETRRVPLANPGLHACFQTIVETQIAMRIPEVVDALERLRSGGLTRHQAVHAIAMALTEGMLPALQGGPPEHGLTASYYERLNGLTAEDWWSVGQASEEDHG